MSIFRLLSSLLKKRIGGRHSKYLDDHVRRHLISHFELNTSRSEVADGLPDDFDYGRWISDPDYDPSDEPKYCLLDEESKSEILNTDQTITNMGNPPSRPFLNSTSTHELYFPSAFRSGTDELYGTLLAPDTNITYSIGSSTSCDICCGYREEHPTVSRKHCELSVLIDGKLRLKDLSSRNGTFVNGKSVRDCDLCPGDAVSLGEWQFIVIRQNTKLLVDNIVYPFLGNLYLSNIDFSSKVAIFETVHDTDAIVDKIVTVHLANSSSFFLRNLGRVTTRSLGKPPYLYLLIQVHTSHELTKNRHYSRDFLSWRSPLAPINIRYFSRTNHHGFNGATATAITAGIPPRHVLRLNPNCAEIILVSNVAARPIDGSIPTLASSGLELEEYIQKWRLSDDKNLRHHFVHILSSEAPKTSATLDSGTHPLMVPGIDCELLAWESTLPKFLEGIVDTFDTKEYLLKLVFVFEDILTLLSVLLLQYIEQSDLSGPNGTDNMWSVFGKGTIGCRVDVLNWSSRRKCSQKMAISRYFRMNMKSISSAIVLRNRLFHGGIESVDPTDSGYSEIGLLVRGFIEAIATDRMEISNWGLWSIYCDSSTPVVFINGRELKDVLIGKDECQKCAERREWLPSRILGDRVEVKYTKCGHRGRLRDELERRF